MTRRRPKKPLKINRGTLDQLRNTVAITLHSPKTCALVFEKLISTPDVAQVAPVEILTYRKGTQVRGFTLVGGGASPNAAERQVSTTVRTGALIGSYPETSLRYVLNQRADDLCFQVRKEGFRPTLCYIGQSHENQIFRSGDQSMIVACIKGLGIVDEDQLTWEQVMEFRKDGESRAQAARLMNWLNEKWNGKSTTEIQDRLCVLLEGRDSALAKHAVRIKAIGESLFAVNKDTAAMSAVTIGGIISAGLAGNLPVASIVGGLHLVRSIWIGVRETDAAFAEKHKATAFFHGLADTLGDPLSLQPGDGVPQLKPSTQRSDKGHGQMDRS